MSKRFVLSLLLLLYGWGTEVAPNQAAWQEPASAWPQPHGLHRRLGPGVSWASRPGRGLCGEHRGNFCRCVELAATRHPPTSCSCAAFAPDGAGLTDFVSTQLYLASSWFSKTHARHCVQPSQGTPTASPATPLCSPASQARPANLILYCWILHVGERLYHSQMLLMTWGLAFVQLEEL